MKRYMAILIILLLLVLPVISCSSVSNLVPKALAAETQKTVQQVEADTDDVFAEIQHNIDLVTALKAKVSDAKVQGQPLSLDVVIKDIRVVSKSYNKLSGQHDGIGQPLSLDVVIKDIRVVSKSYNKLSGQHDSIRRGLLRKIANIEDMQTRVDTEIETLNQRRADYSEQLRAVSDQNPDIVRTRQESLTQAIRYVEAQVFLWTEFNAIEADIIAEMGNVQKSIDSFLSVIDSSAILFREGLNLLVLQRDINEAMSLFTRDLPRMEQLTRDMEKSWANLDYLI